ncbi:MAG: hypothetical protein HYV39_02890 [Candidatus Levybacteria bacterium]|nr:hypothetical protein [Candidatus Levybacteria bacterium]
MDSHKSTVLALSLSVLTLAVVSTFLSLNQSGVLGDSTVGGSSILPKTTPVVRPTNVPSALCHEVTELFDNYCKKGENQDKDQIPKGFCGDIFKLTSQFCPQGTLGPKPTSACKYGTNSFEVGTACESPRLPTGAQINPLYTETGFSSAKYSCYDGTTGEVKPIKGSCAGQSVLRELARKACEGHGTCKNPQKPTNRPDDPRQCTGDNDCDIGQYCQTPKRVQKDESVETIPLGKCLPIPKVTLNPRLTPRVSLLPTRTGITCGWCGLSCVPTRPGLKCPTIKAPANKTCVLSGTVCKIVDKLD